MDAVFAFLGSAGILAGLPCCEDHLWTLHWFGLVKTAYPQLENSYIDSYAYAHARRYQ